MNAGDASDQIVKIILEGTEMSLRLTGAATKNIAAALYAVASDKSKSSTKGRRWFKNEYAAGTDLKAFSLRREDARTFKREAKRYGISYCAIRDSLSRSDGTMEIIVRAADASRINRIMERFNIGSLDSSDMSRAEAPGVEIGDADKLMDELNSEREDNAADTPQEGAPESGAGVPGENVRTNPSDARTENSPSEPSLNIDDGSGRSSDATDSPAATQFAGLSPEEIGEWEAEPTPVPSVSASAVEAPEIELPTDIPAVEAPNQYDELLSRTVNDIRSERDMKAFFKEHGLEVPTDPFDALLARELIVNEELRAAQEAARAPLQAEKNERDIPSESRATDRPEPAAKEGAVKDNSGRTAEKPKRRSVRARLREIKERRAHQRSLQAPLIPQQNSPKGR